MTHDQFGGENNKNNGIQDEVKISETTFLDEVLHQQHMIENTLLLFGVRLQNMANIAYGEDITEKEQPWIEDEPPKAKLELINQRFQFITNQLVNIDKFLCKIETII